MKHIIAAFIAANKEVMSRQDLQFGVSASVPKQVDGA
jgi:hypothetical protein